MHRMAFFNCTRRIRTRGWIGLTQTLLFLLLYMYMKKILLLGVVITILGAGCISTDTIVERVYESIASYTVDISSQELTELPQDILKQTQIEELDISNNEMTGSLPSEIGKLKNLKILNASNNQFTGIPAEIGQLEKLEILDFSNNKLTGLPLELGNLSNLQTLDLSGNNVSTFDLEKIQSSLPESVVIIL